MSLSFLINVPAFAQELGTDSYATAAGRLLPAALAELEKDLSLVNERTRPDEVKKPKDVRKVIVKARDLADLFVYVLPKGEGKKDDFTRLRDALDAGYEIIGAFKDLYDIQDVDDPSRAEYDKSEVKELRKDLLKWKKDFLKELPEFRAYASHPARERVDRKTKNLSDFYWGATGEKAEPSEPAVVSLRRLLGDLMMSAQAEYGDVRDLEHPAADPHAIELYHDFRKRLRTVMKVLNYFPEIAPGLPPEDREFLKEFSSRYGDISDKVTEVELLEKRGKHKKADKLREEIRDIWRGIQAWEAGQDVPSRLRTLKRHIPAAGALRCQGAFSGH